jgi:hypothetical protein
MPHNPATTDTWMTCAPRTTTGNGGCLPEPVKSAYGVPSGSATRPLGRTRPTCLVLLFLLLLACNIGLGVLTFGDPLAAAFKEVPMEVTDKIVWFGVLSTVASMAGTVTLG